jgi:hypothetical protein
MNELGFRAVVRLLIKESEVVRLRAPRGSGVGHPIAKKPDRPNLGSPGKYEKDESNIDTESGCLVKISKAFLKKEESEDGMGYQPYP